MTIRRDGEKNMGYNHRLCHIVGALLGCKTRERVPICWLILSDFQKCTPRLSRLVSFYPFQASIVTKFPNLYTIKYPENLSLVMKASGLIRRQGGEGRWDKTEVPEITAYQKSERTIEI